MKQNTRALTAAIASLLVLVVGVAPATAGTSASPEITDIAGDANGLNGQGRTSVEGRDTRPASVDSADLRAVWFETAFKKVKTVDAASGRITRVSHVATGLKVNIQTQAPVHPASQPQMRPMMYDVLATVGTCNVGFQVTATADAATDTAGLQQLTATCPDGVSPNGESTKPQYNGSVTTVEYTFAISRFGNVLKPATSISVTGARTSRAVPFAGSVVLDEAVAASAFTIGQDLPADIDCTVDTTNSECQS